MQHDARLRHLVRPGLGLGLVFALASCLTTDDDPTLDDQGVSMRPAEAGDLEEPELEPWACSPTITAMSQPAFERGTQHNAIDAPRPAVLTISGQYHVGATLLMPDAGSDITLLTADADASVGGGIQIESVRAPQYVRATTYGWPQDGVTVRWHNPSKVATHTRIRRTGGGSNVSWTVAGTANGYRDHDVLPGRAYVYCVTNYAGTDVSETAEGEVLTPTM